MPQDVVLHEPVELCLQAGDIAFDRDIAAARPIHPYPVMEADGSVQVQRPAPLALYQERFRRAQGVVIELQQIIADCFPGTSPPVPRNFAGHVMARSIDPSDLVAQSVVQFVGAVTANFRIGTDVLEHRLETPDRVWLGAIIRRAGVKLVDDELIRQSCDPVMTEHPPGHCDVRGIRHRLQKVLNGSIARADVDELIDVDVNDPRRIADQRFLQGPVQRMVLRAVAFPGVVGAVLDDSHLLKAVEYLRRPVCAAVRVNQKVVHTDRAMICDPFQDIRGFVFYAADNDVAATDGWQRAGKARSIGRR